MIAADHIVIDGDTACAVEWAAPDSPSGWPATRNLRPCDTCGGDQIVPVGHINYDTNEPVEVTDCRSCDGTGRQTFTIDVAAPPPLDGYVAEPTLRVHVIDVLPIFDLDDMEDGLPEEWMPHITIDSFGSAQSWWHDRRDEWWSDEDITLPPTAEPGMWLIRLEIHT